VTLRTRLLIALVALTAIGLAVAGLVTYRQQQTFLFQRVDQQLSSAQSPMLGQLERGCRFGFGLQGLPYGAYGELVDTSGDVVSCQVTEAGRATLAPPSLPSGLTASTTHYFGAHAAHSGTHYRVLAVGLPTTSDGLTGTLVIAFPLTDVDQTLHHLLLVEILVAAAVLLAIALMAWWVVRLELRPLQEMGATAGAIAAGDLTRRVEPADDRSEVGRLGLALNSMLGQIEVAFEERTTSEARLRRFVADAAHELRTPLTSIRGYAELFRRGASTRPDDLAKTMLRIEEGAARMGVLVEDLLLLARLDQGRPLERESVDLTKLTAAAVDDLRVIAPERPVEYESNGAVVVHGDEHRLRQVVANLLENARTHTPANSPVEVHVGVVGDEAVIEVRDHGPGMAPEDAARVFERFWRADPSRARTSGGAGLGLAIVAAITQAHGGRAEVETAPGAGAAFRVWIPVAGPPIGTPADLSFPVDTAGGAPADTHAPDPAFEALPEVQPE
jgi:two-component system, OmpR family, sensor kinase